MNVFLTVKLPGSIADCGKFETFFVSWNESHSETRTGVSCTRCAGIRYVGEYPCGTHISALLIVSVAFTVVGSNCPWWTILDITSTQAIVNDPFNLDGEQVCLKICIGTISFQGPTFHRSWPRKARFTFPRPKPGDAEGILSQN